MDSQDFLRCNAFTEKRCQSCGLLANGNPERGLAAAKVGALYQAELDEYLECAGIDRKERERLLLPIFMPSTFFPSRAKAKLAVHGTNEKPFLGLTDANKSGTELLDCPLHYPLLNSTAENILPLILEFSLIPYDISSNRGELKFIVIY